MPHPEAPGAPVQAGQSAWANVDSVNETIKKASGNIQNGRIIPPSYRKVKE
ncbi:MAG: hypothetical protein ACE5PV_16260 [Candidatus Poribacteria bacterium]